MLNRLLKYKHSRKGQTSLVLILMAAFALLFFAVSLNWGRTAERKTETVIASRTAVTQMASTITSISEQHSETSLKGDYKYCESTSVWGAIISLLVVIALVAFCSVCGGVAASITGLSSAALATIAITLSVLSLAINVLVIQPGITALWNKLQQNFSQVDQVLEGGLSKGMSTLVDDNETVPDLFDIDLDGEWSDPGFGTGNSDDRVSRYAHHYTHRLQGYVFTDHDVIQQINDLKNSLGTIADQISVPAPINPSDATGNPCCVNRSVVYEPDDIIEDAYKVSYVRNDSCAEGGSHPKDLITCKETTPYNDPTMRQTLVYNPLLQKEDPNATSKTLGQLFGLDDMNRFYDGTEVGPTTTLRSSDGFVGEDATGMFATLWKLSSLDQERINTDYRFDPFSGIPTMVGGDSECLLDVDPAPLKWKKGFDIYCSANEPHDTGCDKHVAAGCPTFPTETEALGMTPEEYTAAIEAASAIECSCSKLATTNPSSNLLQYWNEDIFDQLVIEVKQFEIFARSIAVHDANYLNRTFDNWYSLLMYWVTDSPYTYEYDNSGDVDQPLQSETYDKGRLYVWVDYLNQIKTEFDDWLIVDQFADTTQAFCNPKDLTLMGSTEKAAVIAGVDDTDKTMQCLDYHARQSVGQFQACLDACTQPIPVPDTVPPFNPGQACYDACTTNNVVDLPRPLDPAIDYTLFNPMTDFNSGYDLATSCASSNSTLCMIYNAYVMAINKEDEFAKRHKTVSDVNSEVSALSLDLQVSISNIMMFLEGDSDGDLIPDLKNFIEVAQEAKELNDQKKIPDDIDSVSDVEKEGISNFIIYGWQNEPPNDRKEGYWHLARMEAMSAKRCAGKKYCKKKLPWIRTYTKGFLDTERCYELTDYAGRVAARATRWDESRGIGKGIVNFANGMEMWRFSTSNSAEVDAPMDFSRCWEMNGLLRIADGREAVRAFMIDKVPVPAQFKDERTYDIARQCYCEANRRLRHGVQTTSCGLYYWEERYKDPSLKFIQCEPNLFPDDETLNDHGVDVCKESEWDAYQAAVEAAEAKEKGKK